MFEHFSDLDVFLSVVALGLFVLMCLQILRARSACVLLEDVIDSSDRGLVVFDRDESFLKANNHARLSLPFLSDSTDLTLKTVLDYLFDHAVDVEPGLDEALKQALLDDTGSHFREVIRDEAGRLCLAEVQKTARGRHVIVLQDVDVMKAREDHVLQLSKANQELSEAIEASTCGVLVTDPKQPGHPVLFANRASCDILKFKKPEVIGLCLHIFFERLGHFDAREEILNIFQTGLAYQKEIRIPNKRRTLWFDVRISPVFDRHNVLDLFVAVFTDITMLKTREEEFFKAQKMEALGQLAAGVAHDFNNVLSIIDGYGRMAKKDVQGQVKAVSYLDSILSASQRGAHLTQQMLAFTRHKVISDDIINLKTVVCEQDTLLAPLLVGDVRLCIDCEDDDFFAKCSSNVIAQILMNLVINAHDAICDSGTITITLAACQDKKLPKILQESSSNSSYFCLTVSDTGHGMSKEVQARIFDPFFTTKDQGKGTGLGLSVVYGLVKEIGGHIEISSVLSQGTSFHVYIPKSDQEPQCFKPQVSCDNAALTLSGFTALVAEDEPDLREILCGLLREQGMRVLDAQDGEEALILQDEFGDVIDVLISDVVMPRMNGLKLAELVQSLRPEMKVVFISGYPSDGDMAQVDLPQDAYFLSKPFDGDLLVQVLISLLHDNKTSQDFSRFKIQEWQLSSDAQYVKEA